MNFNKKGKLKNLVESIESKVDNTYQRDMLLEEAMTAELEAGSITIDNIDFNTLASELVSEGAKLSDFALGCGGADAGIKAVKEAMGASAFPILTKTVVGFATIKAYDTAVGDVGDLVSEVTTRSTSQDSIPGFTNAGGFEKREEGMRYEEKHFGEKRTALTISDFGVTFALTAEALYENRMSLLPEWARRSGAKGGSQRAKMIIQTLEMLPRSAFGETTSNLRNHVANTNIISIGNHYNTDHSAVTGLDAQTNANVDTTDSSDLSTDGMSAVADLFTDMVDEKGDEIDIKPTILLVPGLLLPKAWQLLRSAQEFDTANNAKNFYSGLYKPISSVFLNTKYYYYLGDFKSQLLWGWTFKPTVDMHVAGSDEAFMNKVVFRIKFAYHGGCTHSNYVYVVRGGSA